MTKTRMLCTGAVLCALTAAASAQDADVEKARAEARVREARKYYEKGKKWLDKGDWKGAQRWIGLAVDRDPRPEYVIDYCRSFDLNRLGEKHAAHTCDEAARLARGTGAAREIAALRDAMIERYLDRMAPNVLDLVEDRMSRKEYDVAAEYLEDFVAWRPERRYVYAYCRVLEAAERFDEAIAACKKARRVAKGKDIATIDERIAAIEAKKAAVFTDAQNALAEEMFAALRKIDDYGDGDDPGPYRPWAKKCVAAADALAKGGVAPEHELVLPFYLETTMSERREEKPAGAGGSPYVHYASFSKLAGFCKKVHAKVR